MTLTLRTIDGHYVCAEPDGRMVADRQNAGPWETFTVVKVGGKIALLSAHGTYVCAENGGGNILIANRVNIGSWEQFTQHTVGQGVALETANGHYWCAEGGGGADVNATREAIGAWESFNQPYHPEPPEPGPGPPSTFRGRLSVEGEKLYAADGKVFVWRGATGFRLIELVATGREADAVAYLDWARTTGFNLSRVLTMCTVAPDGGMFRLTPQDGLKFLPRTCDLAREHGMYLEVVALAATRRYNFDKEDGEKHLRAVALVCSEHTNTVLQMANEYPDGSQADFVQNPVTLTSLSDVIPDNVLYTVSTPGGDKDEQDQPQGEYMTRHRSRTRDAWNSARRIVEIARVGDRTGRYIVDDEPTGAGETNTGGSRSNMPAIFYWQGLGARGHSIGSTFHYQDGLHAKLPGPKQQVCAEAFIAGSRLVPDDAVFRFENAKHSSSPVKDANFDREGPPKHKGTVVRVFSFIGGTSFTAALGTTADPRVVWQNGWKPAEVLKDYPASSQGGLTVWRITK